MKMIAIKFSSIYIMASISKIQFYGRFLRKIVGQKVGSNWGRGKGLIQVKNL